MIVAAAAIGVAAAYAGWQEGKLPLLRAYLVAWLYWTGLSLGSLSLVLLHNMTGGAWGDAIRPTARAAAATIVLMAIMSLPIMLNVELLYPWATNSGEANPLIEHKRPYLNVGFFHVRAAVYFGIWFALLALLHWQEKRRGSDDPLLERKISRLSGQGVLLHGLATTFAAIDWMMSLEPEWFSTIYGVLVFVSQGLAALAFAVLVFCMTGLGVTRKPVADVLHDLGKLLLGFVMLWAYMSFSQFLIIWYGNLPEEVIWYTRRLDAGWKWLALALVAFHFAVPFVLLLSREWKRSAVRLGLVACLLLVMNVAEKLWMVEPAIGSSTDFMPWLYTGLLLGVGAVWCAGFALNLPRMLVALDDEVGVQNG